MPENFFKFDTPEQKAGYVQDMFSRIAPRYDLMNRVMTLGRDQSWRRLTVKRAGIQAGARVLDIAAGTADLALAARDAKAKLIIAADFSHTMLQYARKKIKPWRSRNGRLAPIHLVTADGLRLPFPNNYFDAVITGFSLRNVSDLNTFLKEMTRVAKPGGKVACLEITRPRQPVFRNIFAWYFGKVVPKIGGAISGASDAYSYLPHSVSIFITPEELRVRMEDAGLNNVEFETLMFGTVAIHWGTKLRATTNATMTRFAEAKLAMQNFKTVKP
ncbi:MAG: bifunctional demethylmenaquinone methyltransferase/2-methoxy-6-polyprenyl-1,4-benzoquinol methylase UbiE [candidate division KSB1 bacterium]|nr:bifunctional demethylmenaquinone methyltransferase/2-methoxy-6-polyprenyl-1,4-benzoquinol methylase UbiE [candidate division KSB1 bacterium]MDZ7368218.1 bifunctional demethylmenaquinone methyltransferase/2-methoxy-6-polyprenyl-1,4-benzoquinol methylase UbiE [candidate division KSB1 bacterium]MDZ7403944.1 bifunctional demethylmenaquinone methyltransferase/2-methoxy-6-polyprenyl-1,4-benzoquinol methylase UbiE [candidate division KSB1 bacterium]